MNFTVRYALFALVRASSPFALRVYRVVSGEFWLWLRLRHASANERRIGDLHRGPHLPPLRLRDPHRRAHARELHEAGAGSAGRDHHFAAIVGDRDAAGVLTRKRFARAWTASESRMRCARSRRNRCRRRYECSATSPSC